MVEEAVEFEPYLLQRKTGRQISGCTCYSGGGGGGGRHGGHGTVIAVYAAHEKWVAVGGFMG